MPTTAPAPTAPEVRSELKPVTPRELAYYRSLIVGEDDKIVTDPKKADATNNIDTRAHKERVAALEQHAGRYDAAAMIVAPVDCETKITTVLNAHAEEPIRRDEDDNQYARRKAAATRGLAMFRRALSAPGEATQEDLRYTFRLLAGQFADEAVRPRGAAPPPKTRVQQEIEGIPERERGVCAAKFLLVVNEYWKRHRLELDAQRAGVVSAKEDEARRAVLERRFAPVKRECADAWRATATQCDELPGLSDDERKMCREACSAAAQEGFKRAFANATTDCFVAEKDGPKECEVKKPEGATVVDDAVKSSVATCKTECASRIKEAKEQKVKDKQECLTFCRDLKLGFCAFTDKPKQVCIDRCIRIKCSD